MTRVILLVVAKAPVPGQVKTRLCPPATPLEAARLAAASLLDTLDTVCSLPWSLPVVAMAGAIAESVCAGPLSDRLADVPVLRQHGETFAERLANAHRDAGRRHPGIPILQIGMDTPQIGAAVLIKAAELLTEPLGPQAVLGPATDGGWWALGLRQPPLASVLASVPMSQGDTGERTAQALTEAGAPPAPLAELSDVDYLSDARAVAELIPESRFAQTLAAMPVESVERL